MVRTGSQITQGQPHDAPAANVQPGKWVSHQDHRAAHARPRWVVVAPCVPNGVAEVYILCMAKERTGDDDDDDDLADAAAAGDDDDDIGESRSTCTGERECGVKVKVCMCVCVCV